MGKPMHDSDESKPTTLLIEKIHRGGYLVSDTNRFNPNRFDQQLLAATDIDDALGFIKDQFEPVPKDGNPVAPNNWTPEELAEMNRPGGIFTKQQPTAAVGEIAVNAVSVAIMACAQAAHEANRAYCIVMGDNSHLPWDEAPAWQRLSAMRGVQGALAGRTPEQSHQGWCADKIAEGWVWGVQKDADAKTHPCLRPYDELPPSQRAKDKLYLAVVNAMAQTIAIGGGA